MSCKNVCKLCNHLVISQSVAFTGGNLVVTLPAGSYSNGEKYCIVIAQSIPEATIPISTTASRFRSENISCAQYDIVFKSLEDRFVLAYHSYDEKDNFLYDSGWNSEISLSKGTRYRLLLKDTMEEYKENDIELITEKYVASYSGIEGNRHLIDELIGKNR